MAYIQASGTMPRKAGWKIKEFEIFPYKIDIENEKKREDQEKKLKIEMYVAEQKFLKKLKEGKKNGNSR